MRKLILSGDINEDLYKEIYLQLLDKKDDVTITLLSDGGDPHVAMAICDLIRSYIGDVTVIATGKCFSAAVLILAAADHRYMTKNSYLMFHEDTIGNLDNKKVSEIEVEAQHARRIESHWALLMSECTGHSVDFWNILHVEETYLNAEEALSEGIIEGIK